MSAVLQRSRSLQILIILDTYCRSNRGNWHFFFLCLLYDIVKGVFWYIYVRYSYMSSLCLDDCLLGPCNRATTTQHIHITLQRFSCNNKIIIRRWLEDTCLVSKKVDNRYTASSGEIVLSLRLSFEQARSMTMKGSEFLVLQLLRRISRRNVIAYLNCERIRFFNYTMTICPRTWKDNLEQIWNIQMYYT